MCTSRRKQEQRPPHWLRPWMLGGTVASGILALAWLIFRSGTKPTRLAYPCQQAALGAATAAFGAPVVLALVGIRQRWDARMRTPAGRAGVTAAALSLGVIVAVASTVPVANILMLDPPADYEPNVYMVRDARGVEPGRFGGVDDLVTLMGHRGLKWHRSALTSITSGPGGMIDADDVVILKVNAQWSQRGGTNTDVLRGVIRRIVEHPDGFVGEIIVADNGQGAGNLNRAQSNAEDHSQSAQDVVNDFANEGWKVATKLWDPLGYSQVTEYETGNMADGYVVNATLDPETFIKLSYPKFRSSYGSYVSYKRGIWSTVSSNYDADKLVVINMPVFKTHSIYAITAAVKNYMGVVTRQHGTDAHNAVRRGGMGSMLAEVRAPDLNILDCIWILARPGQGPGATYAQATRRDVLLASTDPVALDMWATKYVMIPQIVENGYSYNAYHNTQDPDNPNGVFRHYLDLSMNEMLVEGIDTTNDYSAVSLHLWLGDLDRDGDVDVVDFAEFDACSVGPGATIPPGCDPSDLDGDGDIDFADFSRLQIAFTGEL